jgi:hypothetical protein
MKASPSIFKLLLIAGLASTSSAGSYTNFIRQTQIPSGVQWDVTVDPKGEQQSYLPLDEGGSRFDLWTVLAEPFTGYLLDTRYVGAYIPSAEVAIRSEDPYPVAPRTRADRPFTVEIVTSGLRPDAGAPDAARQVRLVRHHQSYGAGGTGENLDRSQATLVSQAFIAQNGTHPLAYPMSSVPSADASKATGEERFSVFSLADDHAPEGQLAARTIQIWPVADGSIFGISPDQKIRFQVPQLTITLNDLYPESHTYAQVYQGEPVLGKAGTLVPGTSILHSAAVPTSRVLVLDGYDSVFDADGRWTMELLTVTPFGIDRLSHVTFEIDRTIKVNGMLSTID